MVKEEVDSEKDLDDETVPEAQMNDSKNKDQQDDVFDGDMFEQPKETKRSRKSDESRKDDKRKSA